MEALVNLIVQAWEAIVPWQQIDRWERGLSVWFGRYVTEKGPGFYLRFPLFQSYVTDNVLPDIVDCQFQSVDTLGNKSLAIHAMIEYEIVDMRRLWLTRQSHQDSLRNKAEGLIASYIMNNWTEYCDGDMILDAVRPVLQREAASWGIRVIDLTLGTKTGHIPLRLLAD
jgi:hypothetical protein